MRCEGAENPPCRRCRHAGLECLFEKPTREASLTGEAGLEYVPLTRISPSTDSPAPSGVSEVSKLTLQTFASPKSRFRVLLRRSSLILGMA